ncbi:MAG TPA: CHAD domain-containing protein [Armatimonadota bacterium]|jgi:CHAD domain-containing protein
MAKAILPEGMTAASPARVVAGKFLAAKMQEYAAFLEPAQAGDVDGIHDLRVAIKRLREAVRLFWPLLSPRERKSALAAVERLNDSLGQVRDRDVLLEHLLWLAQTAPEAAPALEQVVGAWSRQRCSDHERFVEELRHAGQPGVFARRLKRLARDTRQRRSLPGTSPVDRFFYRAVTARLAKVFARAAEAGPMEDAATLHVLRIAIKRLKYSLEPCLTILPELAGPYRVVAAAQEALGLAHDFDVLELALRESFPTADSPGAGRMTSAWLALENHRRDLYAEARVSAQALLLPEWKTALLDALD